MSNIIDLACYGSDGSKINNLTQWDKGQAVYFDTLGLTTPPVVHWCNRMSEEALQVKSVLKNNQFCVDVPNSLLQDSYPLIGYIYLYDSNSTSETIAQIRIPVKSRQKPSDYYYINNVDFVVSYQVGTFQLTTGSSIGTQNYSVIFPNKFKSIPVVFATTSQVDPQNYSISVTGRTQTGATFCIYNTEGGVNKSLTISWIAIIP
ncbi:MAG TPA: hypothetical protein DCW90_15395 [Lachnospiraceae bacterium]|nr:hypothetical protein [Lachnospiraceae bacterium]